MPHDIIDNRETFLGDAVRPLLTESERAHFAVGFFFLSGFKAIARELDNVRELRLLIGNTTDSCTVEQLAEAHASAATIQERIRNERFLNSRQREQRLAESEQKIRARIERMDQTDDDQGLIERLCRLINEKRISVRLYTRGRLHAKAYIFDYPAGRFERGLAIVGSSNLSLAGLQDNTELNVVVHGNSNHEQLRKWFDRLWEESEPFDANLMRELQLSWALNDKITPYELYLKVLYHLTRDRLEEPEVPIPEDFPPLADFQWAAVKSALRILRRQNGVFISDVVGLGKTFIAAALLKWLKVRERKRALILCPAPLVRMWRERFVDRYDLGAEVLSLGMLSQSDFDWSEERFQNKQIVLLDESHNLRHSDTERYDRLCQFVHSLGLPMILLTATPRNSRARDILNQIKLFHPEDRIELGVEPRWLSQYFKQVEAGERPLPPLLQHFLIRRTRHHIREHWPAAQINGRPVRFPERRLKTIEYNIEQTYAGFYHRLRELIEPPDPARGKTHGLTYARYGLHRYVRPEKQRQEPYRNLARAGQRLRGLMRTLLFKRLESSVEAFRQTLNAMAERHRLFLRGLDEGIFIVGEKVEDILRGIEPGDAERDDLMDALKSLCENYEPADFLDEQLRDDVTADLKTLEEMICHIAPITPDRDAKLQRLIRWLDEDPLFRTHKLLIFTQYVDTAQYLFRELRRARIRPESTIEYADSTREDLQTLVARFAPLANEAGERERQNPIHILVATDVLSEGLNLQDAALIINYDLHFNPVRLIQRFGRIDRINSPHREIFAYNFLPELELERHLHLREILQRRIEEIHRTIGEDAAILEPDEQLNPDAMYVIYEGDGRKLETIEESQEETADLAVQEAEDLLRRLKREQPELYERIASLPNAVRTGRVRAAQKTGREPGIPAVFFFGQAGDFQRLWVADGEGKILSEDNPTALAAIACGPNEPRCALPPGFNGLVQRLKQEFERQYRDYRAATGIPTRLTPSQQWALEVIARVFSETGEDASRRELETLRQLWSVSPLDSRTDTALRLLRKRNPAPPEAIKALQSLAFEHRLDQRIERPSGEGGENFEDEPLIICTEALV